MSDVAATELGEAAMARARMCGVRSVVCRCTVVVATGQRSMAKMQRIQENAQLVVEDGGRENSLWMG